MMPAWLRRRRRFRASDPRWRALDEQIASGNGRGGSPAPGLRVEVEPPGWWWTAPPAGGERVATEQDRTEILRRPR